MSDMTLQLMEVRLMRVRFLILAVAYVVIGIVVGLIDAAGSFEHSSMHAPINLIGWGAFVIIVDGLACAANDVVLAIAFLMSGVILTVTVRAACTWVTNVVEYVRC